MTETAPIGALETRLRLTRPTDLRRTLGHLWRGPRDPSMRLRGDGIERATLTPMGAAAVELRGAGDVVAARAWGTGAPWVLDHLPGLCGELDDDSGFAPRHPVVARLRRRLPGLHLGRTDAVFEAVVHGVLEQRVSSDEARTGWVRLAHALGEPAPGPLGLLLPPSPARLGATPGWRLAGCGVEGGRAATLRRAAHSAGRLEETAAMSADAARCRLLALAGIGPWTAATVALVARGDPDAVPLGDYNLPHLVAWALAGEPRGSDARMLELLEPFAGHRGRVLRLLLSAGARPPRRGPRLPRRDISRL